jgi:hypothetical protein
MISVLYRVTPYTSPSYLSSSDTLSDTISDCRGDDNGGYNR